MSQRMKIRGVILLLVLVLSLFQYLGSEKYPWPIREESALPAAGENLRLTVADTITPAGGMFTLWNSTTGTVPVGEGYTIEIWYREGWHTIRPKRKPDWPLTLWEPGPGKHSFPVDWTALYGELPRGALPAGEALFPKTALSFLPV